MAKASAWTVVTALQNGSDRVLVLRDPGGTPGSATITADNLMQPGFGEIYAEAVSGSQSLATSFEVMTQFTQNGESYLSTPDHTQDRVTVTNAGIYRVEFDVSFDTKAAAETVTLCVYVNGTTATRVRAQADTTASEITHLSAGRYLDLAASDYVELRFKGAAATGDFDLKEGGLSCRRMVKY